jgi:hypothetical protein
LDLQLQSLVHISKELVESLGIGAEDKFTVRKTKAGIALKKAE